MKVHKSIDHYSAKERKALYVVKNAIVAHLQPLIIYCLTMHSTITVERSCFIRNKRIEEWSFDCDLLIVLSNDVILDADTKQQVEQLNDLRDKVTAILHPVDYFIQKVKEKNPFFFNVHRHAAVVYEKEVAAGLIADSITGGVQQDNYNAE